MERLRAWWGTFKYNYRWSDWVRYIDGWMPRFSLFVPIVGYLILFNDHISEIIQFEQITHHVTYDWGLDANTRLRFVYYGLFFLGVSNFIFRLKKPHSFRFGRDLVTYTTSAFEIFTYSDFSQIHSTIRHDGHLTLGGKYYDSEWDGFSELARNPGEGTDRADRSRGSWEDAKMRYGSLLRSMLRENFFRHDIRRRNWLTVCLLLSTAGYIFLALPSIDLFLKITISTFTV